MKIQSWDRCFIRSIFISAALALALAGCGGGGGGGTETVTGATSYTVGGLVTGLTGTLVLQDNGGDNLTVPANSKSFTFATQVASGSAYNITVLTQPAGQICSVFGGSGTVSGIVNNVAVSCTKAYTVGGSVKGLSDPSDPVVLRDNGGDNLTISADGPFTFVTPVADGSPYKVTVFTQPANETCSVSSGAGTVSAGNVIDVTVVCSATAYTVSVSVSGLNGTAVLQINDGDNLTVTNNNTFPFVHPVAEGSPYYVTLLSLQFPNQTCTITGDSSTGNAVLLGDVTVAVVCSKNTTPRFAYVANNGSDTVSAYTIDPGTGVLTDVGAPPVATGSLPFSVTVDPSGRFAYVANNYSDDISAYTVTGTGALTPIICSGTCSSGNNFPAGSFPSSVSVDSTGKFVYVANWGDGITPGTVSAYTIGSTGALTPAGTAVAGSKPNSVTVDPSGQFAYVANFNSDDVSAYKINSTTGALTPIPCATGCSAIPANFAAGSGPGSVTVDPTGKFAYVANHGDGTVSGYTIDSTTGALTPNGTAVAGSQPNSVTVDPSGKFAYVANWSSGPGTISAYSIDGTTGALTGVPSSPFAAGTGPFSITVDPSGKFVYVANEGDGINPGTVSAYTIDSSGALISIGAADVTAGISPFSVTTTIHFP